jgi:ABC-type Mn2+/Zn2+ transport system permease subunit
VFALMLIPASSAYQLTHSLAQMTFYSVCIGTGCAAGGVLVSYWWDLPSGPTIVLMAALVFILTALLSPKRRRIAASLPTH